MYTIQQLNKKQKLKKLIRFYQIYGLTRTYIKLVGRLRYNVPLRLPLTLLKSNNENIALIGCGQFAFTTIGYFLRKHQGKAIYGAYDLNKQNSISFTNYFGGRVFEDYEELLSDKKVKLVYIASNHASHTDYAIKALKKGKQVYIEKPVSVNKDQFESLLKHYKKGNVFVGYNRPFSPAIVLLVSFLNTTTRTPLTLSCFVSAHKIPHDNWYRNPEEGTRICGNLGHWLDLSIHLLYIIGSPTSLKISIQTTSDTEPDDNLSITIISDQMDLINLIMTSRTEPFEGINESINFQHGEVIAKIDDFHNITIWEKDLIVKKSFKHKDVGHQSAILQPFKPKSIRNFNEIKTSTLLMINIKDSILNGINEFTFNLQ